LDNDDDTFEILFKYYETLKNYQGNINGLIKRIKDYNEDQAFAQKILMKPK
jgi:hypothetical protein